MGRGIGFPKLQTPCCTTLPPNLIREGDNYLDTHRVCLAHLIRDFRAMAEGEEELRWIGQGLLALIGEVFRL